MRVQKKRGAYKAFVMIKGNMFINIMLLEKNMNIKDVSCEFSEENEKHSAGNWRKGDPHYKVAENVVELCSAVVWKAELNKQ